MAQKVSVLLIDDIDGSDADESIEFAIDGVLYAIDLSTEHAEELRDALNDYIDAGRRLGRIPAMSKDASVGGSAPAAYSGKKSSNGLVKEDRIAIRNWAEQNDISVSDRGRIAQSLIDGWKEAGSPRPDVAEPE